MAWLHTSRVGVSHPLKRHPGLSSLWHAHLWSSPRPSFSRNRFVAVCLSAGVSFLTICHHARGLRTGALYPSSRWPFKNRPSSGIYHPILLKRQQHLQGVLSQRRHIADLTLISRYPPLASPSHRRLSFILCHVRPHPFSTSQCRSVP